MGAWRRAAVRKRVLVNLRTGTTFHGILWEQRGPLLVLKDAMLLADRGNEVPSRPPVEGEVVVEIRNVDFVQVLGGEA